MKFKYYLRGVGLGILLTTILLTAAFHIHGNRISDEEIIEKAQGLGMIMPGESLQSEADETETAESEEQTGLSEETEPADTGIADMEPEDVTQEQESTALPAIPEADENTGDVSGDYITVTVAEGAVCRDIAEELMELGLVEDSEDFRLYMAQNSYDHLIRVGEYEIPREATYEEIARILTQK